MGTRSLTKIYEDDKLLLTLYCQFDGYLDGVGKDIATFAASRQMVNGISNNESVFNGMGCFAAQLVAHLKTEAGLWYVYPAGAEEQEFNYEIHGGYLDNWEPKPITMKVKGYGVNFEGTPTELLAYIQRQHDARDKE